jgi:hypothetical protein
LVAPLLAAAGAVAPEVVKGVMAVLDRVIPDAEARNRAKLEVLKEENQQALREIEAGLSAILAEAQSADPWTSRARPTFLYVIYAVILLCVVGSVVGIWWPGQVFQASENLSRLLGAVPESLWWRFGAGYLGYTGARSFDKWRGLPR